MKRSKILPQVFVFFVFVALWSLPVPGQASTIILDRDDWITAVSGRYQDVNLSVLNPPSSLSAGTLVNLPYSGLNLSFNTDLEVGQVPDDWLTWLPGVSPTVLISFGASVTGSFIQAMYAFGMEIQPAVFDVFAITLRLSDGTTETQPVDGNAGARFFGWVGDSASPSVMSFTIEAPDAANGFAIGRMVEGNPVPLPPSVLLLGSGLLGFFGIRRFKN